MIPFDGEKLERLLGGRNVDVVLATTRQNVRYLTGGYYLPFFARTPRFGGSQYLSIVAIPAKDLASAFYVGRKDPIMNERDYIDVFGPFWITNTHWVPRGGTMSAAAAETAAQVLRHQGYAGGTIAIESSFLPADAFEALRRTLPEASFVNATPILADLRAVKRPAELERLREVHQITAEAIHAVLSDGHAEQTTRQIATDVQRRVEERGASFLYAFTNVGPGFLRAPSSAPWGRGQGLHVDAGAELDEYIADIARMGSVGKPPALAMDLFHACLEAQERVRSAVRAGLPCRDLWRIGTEAVTSGRWGQYGRFLAHGLGMVSHEFPEVNEKSTGALDASMVVSIETEYLHPDAGHVKHEDTVVVTPIGHEGLGDVARDWCVAADAGPRP
jgi:Xaa-Pro aminopeptidase